MKYIFMSMMLLFGAFAMPAQAGLVGLYRFDNVANLGQDSSGYNNDATNFGATYSATGYNNGSVLLDGAGHFLRVPINVDPSVMPSMTWGAWVKPIDTNPVSAVFSADSCCYDRDIDIDSRGGSTSWSAFTGNGVVGSGVSPSMSDWTFLAASYDQSTQTMSFFVNGNAAIVVNTNFDTIGNHNFFDIGNNPDFGEYFTGYIDNVFVYDETLNTDQIASVRSGNFSVYESSPLMLLVVAAVAYGLLRRMRFDWHDSQLVGESPAIAL